MNFLNAYFSHAKIWLYYVMFSSNLYSSVWHFPPPFFFFFFSFLLLEGNLLNYV